MFYMKAYFFKPRKKKTVQTLESKSEKNEDKEKIGSLSIQS